MTAPPKPRKQTAWVATRPPTRGGDPAPLGRVLADTQKAASSRTGAALSPDEWRLLVGHKIASRTRVGRLSHEVLTVYVASSVWCNELSLLAPDILSRLQRAGHDVSKLELRVSAFEEPSAPVKRTASGRATPSRAGSSRPPSAAPQKKDAAGPQGLPASLRERLALIEDPELRAAIAEAAALSLGARR